MSHPSQQQHRHGVTKKLVEGAGGFLAGAALVLFLRGLAKRRNTRQPAAAHDGTMPQATSGDSV